MAHTTTSPNLTPLVRSALGGRYPHVILASMPPVEASAEEIAKTTAFFGEMHDKAAYLAWVATFKGLVKDLEAEIRSLKAQRFDGSCDIRAIAQSRASQHAEEVTALIRMRRLGKTWSAAKAREIRSQAA